MPRYSYVCLGCGEHFDVDKPLSLSDIPTPCLMCGSRDTRKVYFPPAVTVKGLPKNRFHNKK